MNGQSSYGTGVDIRATAGAIEQARSVPANLAQGAENTARAARQRADDISVLARALDCFMDAPTTNHADRQKLSDAVRRLLAVSS